MPGGDRVLGPHPHGRKELAADIAAAQDPEIETMTGWLESWDEEVPDGGMAGMGHGDLSHDEMPGMTQELLAP